jgi:hypothetical protein
VPDFGHVRESDQHALHHATGKRNPLMAAYPVLWPYGVGGIEVDRKNKVSFNEHVRWALQYHDRRFRLHHSFPFVAFGIAQKHVALYSARVEMKRDDFEKDGLAMTMLTVNDLIQAEKEEAQRLPISNPRVQALQKHVFAASGRIVGLDNSHTSYRGQIWGTSLWLRPPSLWITINPVDIHDPIAQVFAEEAIDMDRFLPTVGPDSQQRARNIVKDPYTAAKFFFFIINTVLITMFGITVQKSHVISKMGALGRLSGYFGVVEAQG